MIVDVNRDEVLSPHDALLVINQLGRVTRPGVRSMVLTGGLTPDSDRNGNGVVLQGHVTIAGQTLPGAAVRIRGVGDDRVITADATGRYQIELDIPPGLSTLRIGAADAWGQGTEIIRTARYGDYWIGMLRCWE